ncbi:MAG TPA: hypothetical protein VFR24_00145 [Candidatus Angelobacter sp.]|nr:hypothetical protein [Candidatus Angelobacter sp.]
MSKANIINTEKLANGRVRISFDAADGIRVYEYQNSSVRALNRGKDPADLSGRLVEHKKVKK